MLRLSAVKKDYIIDKTASTHALKGISIDFPNTGFVAILGPSGCGKTTLLNIVSGLDRYTEGDLVIDGVSTKSFKDRDWDDYRNKKVGMVFQSYNLIPHLTIEENAALPLTLAGVAQKDRKAKAEKALAAVGLKDQAKKRPNQLSGGQQQRVAIARALINDPSILLADEPTGALDSVTSVQVMDILFGLSKTKLIVMVTHNKDLAYQYANRIIQMRDGLVVSDAPNVPSVSLKKDEALEIGELESQKTPKSKKKSKMSFWTAFSISLKNLLTKKGRTALTAIAASFGIIGVGLVLAVSTGFSDYVGRMENESLAKFPITISSYAYGVSEEADKGEELERYPSDGTIHVYNPESAFMHVNKLTADYYDKFLYGGTDSQGKTWKGLDPSLYGSIRLSYSVTANVIAKANDDSYAAIDTSPSSGLSSMIASTSSWQEIPGDQSFIESQYDLIEGHYPTDQETDGLLIAVDTYNRVSTQTLEALGFDTSEFESGDKTTLSLDELNAHTFKMVTNDAYYQANGKTNGNINGIAMLKGKDYNQFVYELSDLASKDTSSMTQDEKNQAFKSLLSYFAEIPDGYRLSPYLQGRLTSYLNAFKNDTAGKVTWSDTVTNILNELENPKDGESQGLTFNRKDKDHPLVTYTAPDANELKNLYETGSRDGTGGKSPEELHIVGVLRPKSTTAVGILGSGVYYTAGLTNKILSESHSSEVSSSLNDYLMIDFGKYTDQQAHDLVDRLGSDAGSDIAGSISQLSTQALSFYSPFDASKSIAQSDYGNFRGQLGADPGVTSITIYPVDFKKKAKLLAYLDTYNEGKALSDKVVYSDVASVLTDSIGTMVSVISTVLIVFASISLVVSSVMIGIIVYVSVIERTKEIGTLRSIGARKKDVASLFIMESVTIGALAGIFGVLMVYLLSIPINAIINAVYSQFDIGTIALLNPLHGLGLIAISVLLTFVAGLLPSRIAGNKDPVTCLRTDS